MRRTVVAVSRTALHTILLFHTHREQGDGEDQDFEGRHEGKARSRARAPAAREYPTAETAHC